MKFWEKEYVIREVSKGKKKPTSEKVSPQSQQHLFTALSPIENIFGSIWNIAQTRLNRYGEYNRLDRIIPEISMTLDIYTDELLSTTFFNTPLTYQLKGNSVSKEQKKEFDLFISKTKILERIRGHVRAFLKYGDLGFCYLPKNEILQVITPEHWSVDLKQNRQTGKSAYSYKLHPVDKKRKDRLRHDSKVIPAHLMTHISLHDDEYEPYGKSAIEVMRASGSHYVVMLTLLSQSREAKVERLIIRVPTNEQEPTAAAQRLNMIKEVWKNSIFGAGGSKRSSEVGSAFTDIILIPSDEGYNIERMPSSTDITTIDDVEFVRQNLQNLSKLPRSQFVNDEMTDRGSALQTQDLKFARVILPYQDMFVRGMTRVFMLIAANMGFNLEKIDISVNLARPGRSTSESLSMLTSVMSSTKEFLTIFGIDTEEEPTPEKMKMFMDIAKVFGLSAEVATHLYKIITKTYIKVPDNVPQKDPAKESRITLFEALRRQEDYPIIDFKRELVERTKKSLREDGLNIDSLEDLTYSSKEILESGSEYDFCEALLNMPKGK